MEAKYTFVSLSKKANTGRKYFTKRVDLLREKIM